MKKVLLTLGIAVIIASCGSTKTEEKSANQSNEMVEQTEETESEKTTSGNDLTAVIDAYLTVKDALVSDNQTEAATAGSFLAKSLSALDLSKYSDDQQGELKEIIDVAKNHGEHISESEIAHQREHFEALSKDIKDLVALVGTDRTLYHQYCPMYNSNQGGMWLSASEEIRNPLFGASMLKCGKVEEVISL